MYSLNISLENPEFEAFIKEKYGDDKTSLIRDFVNFIKAESQLQQVAAALEELDKYKQGKLKLDLAEDFLAELENES